jgi:Cu+-exporting ATPase
MEAAPSVDLKTCYHCGEDCDDTPVLAHEKAFCCEGCKVVYEILDTNNLCTYYTIENRPGNSVKDPVAESRLAYLDDVSVINQLLDFQNSQISKITFYIPQMHCSSCIWLLENMHKLDAGVTDSKVNFLRKEVALTYEHEQTSLRKIVKLLADVGYEPNITLSDTEAKMPEKSYLMAYKLGLAGFCFANIMLLSFPEYLAVTGELEKSLGSFFSYLNIVLALPVLLFSARGFFVSALQGIKQKMVNLDLPIAIGLISLFSVSLYDILTGKGPGFLDSFTGLVFFMLIGKYFQQKTYDSLSFDRDYTSYFPISVTVLRNNQETYVPVKELKTGQRLLIRNHELIPADAILMKGTANIDYSFVSGESVPVAKVAGEIIYAGGRQVGESIELEVVKEVSQGYLTQLWNSSVFRKKEETNFETYAHAVGKYFISVTLLIAAGALVYWVPRDVDRAIKAFTSVLVIACPCALSLATPFTLGSALRIFGKNKFYLKNLSVVEEMAKADTIVFDKTGTLTETDQSEINYFGKAISPEVQVLLKSVLKHSTHPLSQRIYSQFTTTTLPVINYSEIPGKGIEAEVKSMNVRIGSAAFTGAEAGPQTETRVYIRLNGTVYGYYVFMNKYRKGLETVLNSLQKVKKLAVLSGDNDSERARLKTLFGPEAELNFNQSPVQKLEYIQQLKDAGHRVIMIGDGLNDAGALKQADAGIALTDKVSGFSPSCDGILEAKNFAQLATFLKFSKVCMRIILGSFGVSFIYNILGLSMAVMGEFTPIVSAILMPVSTISVIVFATISVQIAANKMNLNKPEKLAIT